MSEKIHNGNNYVDDEVRALLDGPNVSGDANIMGIDIKRKLLNRGERLLRLVDLQAPEIIIQKERDLIERDGNPDFTEMRETLSNLPEWAKKAQNDVFRTLMDGLYTDRAGNDFINGVVPVEREREASAAEILLNSIFGEVLPHSPRTELDYVAGLTRKDENGAYILPNEAVGTFVEWYHNKIAQLEGELDNAASEFEASFVKGVDYAIEKGLLPAAFAQAAKQLDTKSPDYRRPNYHFADYSSPDLIRYSGACIRTPVNDMRDKLWLKLNRKDYHTMLDYEVLSHEDTHYISGNGVMFGYNDEAFRIVNEGITETTSHLIHLSSVAVEDDSFEDDLETYEFGDGKAYSRERSVLKFLQSGGKTKIDPMLFFEAYVEKDERLAHLFDLGGDYEKWLNQYYEDMEKQDPDYDPADFVYMDIDMLDGRDSDMIERYIVEKQIYGPKTAALYEALYQAFPDCHNPEELGELIVNALKNTETRHA